MKARILGFSIGLSLFIGSTAFAGDAVVIKQGQSSARETSFAFSGVLSVNDSADKWRLLSFGRDLDHAGRVQSRTDGR